jgi:hypothetical protein
MSFWNEDNYKVRLVDFTERFIPHNTSVKLFIHKRVKDEQGLMVNQFDLLWSGMDWQITEDYINSDYFKFHPDILPCPYSEANVVSLTSAGISGDFTDDASLVIEV